MKPYRNSTRGKLRARIIESFGMPLIPFLIVLIIWEALSRTTRPDLFPSPILVGSAIMELVGSGMLLEHASASIFRVFSGFLLATLAAVPLGIIWGWNRRMRLAFSPIVEVFRTISPISWVPIAILWFGIGNLPAIFIIFVSSFFPIIVSTMHAVQQIDPILIRVARNFGANGFSLYRHLILPASLPNIFIGLRISLGISWVVIVAAEMVGLQSGLGYLIMDSRNMLRTDFVIAAMVVIGLIGFSLDKMMRLVVGLTEKHRTRSEKAWGNSPS
jgi:NitT/TauT family transport system permease protein